MRSWLGDRDPVRLAGWWLRWALVPAALGLFVSGNVDARSLPFFGAERESAVLLLDGQAYFGHLDDSGETGSLLLRDVYYSELQRQARSTADNVDSACSRSPSLLATSAAPTSTGAG